MSCKYVVLIAAVFAVTACADSPQEPSTEVRALDQTTHAADAATPVAPSLDDHTARFEFYFNGKLKEVYRGQQATSPQNFDEFTNASFSSLVEKMDKHPANARSVRLANALRGLDKIPENTRANAFEARTKQLIKETPHTLTKLSDGTRIIEFRFDGQLASRVVIPASVAFASARPTRAAPLTPGLIARDVATGDECYDCWTEADEIYYWGMVTYAMDQGAAIDYQGSELYAASPIAAFDISSEANCLNQYKDFLMNTAEFMGLVAGAGSNWEGITSKFFGGLITAQEAKWLKLSLASTMLRKLDAVWTTYNAYHDCLWAWKRG